MPITWILPHVAEFCKDLHLHFLVENDDDLLKVKQFCILRLYRHKFGAIIKAYSPIHP